VTLAQGTPSSATVAHAGGYSGQLTVTNANGPVTFAETSSTHSSDVVVSSTGIVTAATSLAPATYSVSGTESDASGDAGSWSFSLIVSVFALLQGTPTTGTTTVAGSASFTDQLTVTNAIGAVGYVVQPPSATFRVAAVGGIVSTTGPLSQGTYSLAGIDQDSKGDSGTFTYTLTVTP
jgi:hypothetical protein